MKKEPLKQKIKNLFINLWKWVKRELKDPWTFITFIIVCIVVSSEVWVMYLLYIITWNEWFLGIATTLWGIWLLPGIGFIPICLAITVGIKAIINKIRSKNKNGH